jgi:hypothetical protein
MKELNIQPVALTSSVANLLNPNVSSLSGPVGFTMGQPYLIVTQARVVNKDSAPHTCTFWKGATGASAAGTEIWANGQVIPAKGFLDIWFGRERFDAADFLTGQADANTVLTLLLTAEIGVSG